MNGVDLANMDQKDLEELHLKSLKIMELRELKIIDAIAAFDIDAFKKALETNKDKILSSRVWYEIYINMHCINAENIDMFLFIKNLPQFEVQNINTNSNTNIIEEAICKSFFDEKLFYFFYSNKEFSPILKSIASTYAFVDTVPKEIIHKLFQFKIIKPTKKTFNKVLEEKCFNYLEYILDNKIYDLTQSDYLEIYLNIWSIDNKNVLEKIKKKMPNYNEIPLISLIVSYGNEYVLKKEEQQQKYVLFVGLDADIFSRTLQTHQLTKNDFFNCIKAFDSRQNNIEENFHYLVQVVMENYSEYYSMLTTCKGLITSRNFMLMYKKALQYADLNMNLEKQDIKEKKMKL